MTDEQQVPQDGDASAAGEAGAGVDYAVAIAAFPDVDGAMVAYRALQDAEEAGELSIDGVLVLETDEDAKIRVLKMTDHSTRTGLKWGVAGGIVLGVLFPPSILASAATLGVVGGIVGKIRNQFHRSEVGEAMAGALGPQQSGLLVLVKASDLEGATAAMPEARLVRSTRVDEATAARIREASSQAS